MGVYDSIGVVVPAKNERDLLPRCLEALETAAGNTALTVEVMVVLDDCSDGSEQLLKHHPMSGLQVMRVRKSSVGAARAAGFAALLGRARVAGGLDTLWLATTDADSTVPSDWFERQLWHAGNGADIVAGTVRVQDWSGRSAAVRSRAENLYGAGVHRHIHGANLSFTAAGYRAVGGFGSLRLHEDVTLVRSFIDRGMRVEWATDLSVVTSARRLGRAPGGFSGHLDSLELNVFPAQRTLMDSETICN